MKKSLILAVAALISFNCFAQKDAVREAKNQAMKESPDFAAARAAIVPALTNDETKDQAETWYVAGLIGYRQYQNIYFMAQMGQAIDDAAKGAAVEESIEYWLVADKLAMTPVYDKKGKAKYDTRTRKNIAEKILEYYQQMALPMYGQYLSGQNNDMGVAKAFDMHCQIPDLEMMQEKKYQEAMPKDSTYYEFLSYALSYYYRAGAVDEALAVAQRLENVPSQAVKAYQYFYDLYKQKGDTVTAEQKLDEAIVKFPTEPWFIQNKINDLINAQDTVGALNALDNAIANDPQAQYFNTKGTLLGILRRFEEAYATFDQAIAIDPNNPEFYVNYGNAINDESLVMLEGTDNLTQAEFNKVKNASLDVMRKALPYYRRAHELDPQNYNYARSLKQCYYRLDMTEEYEALSNEMNNY